MILGRRTLAWIRLIRRQVVAGLGEAPHHHHDGSALDDFVGRLWSYAKFGGMLVCCQTYLLDITMCIGPSMIPTFNAVGDIVLCDKLSPRLRLLKRGDVVVCKSPTNSGQTVCKRIIGMPGDALDGKHRQHSWLDQRVVPAGHVWLEGDNRLNSMDSRNYGPIPFALVQSRVLLKLWPLHQAGLVTARSEGPRMLRYSDSVRAPFKALAGFVTPRPTPRTDRTTSRVTASMQRHTDADDPSPPGGASPEGGAAGQRGL